MKRRRGARGPTATAVVERSPADPPTTESIGAELGRVLRGGDLVLLSGELGAGKTTLVRGIAAGLGHDAAQVSSPTFILCQEHRKPGASTLAHVDAWRLRGPEDLESIGWDELRDDPEVVTCIEWPERVGLSPTDATVVVLIEHAESGRHVRITIDAQRAARLEAARATATCRVCGKPTDVAGPQAPFCSQRCRMADLHRWFSGDYRIERALDESDFSESGDDA